MLSQTVRENLIRWVDHYNFHRKGDIDDVVNWKVKAQIHCKSFWRPNVSEVACRHDEAITNGKHVSSQDRYIRLQITQSLIMRHKGFIITWRDLLYKKKNTMNLGLSLFLLLSRAESSIQQYIDMNSPILVLILIGFCLRHMESTVSSASHWQEGLQDKKLPWQV